MIIVQNESVVDTSDLQTKLERTKERFENRIIKKETEYAKLWNDWYKKCDECKYDKISYDKAYKYMQQKIKRLQAQLGDLKGKSKDTSCILDTRNPLSQKLENKNVELEFRVLNYARENGNLKATYKNLFDSISVSLSDQKDNIQDTSKNTKFLIKRTTYKNALSNPVTSNLVSSPQESKGVNNDKVIAPGMFRINPSKTSREEKHVPNTVKASARTKPITVSQPHVITKKDVNSDLNGLSSTGVDNTKTRRPQPRSNTKHDRVPSASKSSRSKNKEAQVEEHHRNLLLSKNNKHISSKQKAKVSVKEIQKKYQPKVANLNKVGTHESLATPKPRKPRFILRWSPTGKMFNQEGKLVDSSKSKSKSNGDNACTSNVLEPKIKRFPNSTSLLDRNDLVAGLPKFKYHKEHLCPSCEQGKSKRASHPPKPVPNSRQRLHLLHMDLCGPNVDDYSHYTWVHFLRSKDEAPEVIIKFLKRITVLLQSPVIIIRTDNGTEFKNQVLKEYFDTVGISHQMSSVRTPQQNRVVERRNRMLVEAAKTMLIFSRAL
nr:retrotransposon protein, putative, Ty1-copia subclass [Tanacetum cinerariifolium]